MRLIDTHCHLYEASLVSQLPHVIEQAAKRGVKRMIAVATDARTSLECVRLAEEQPSIFASVGLHPNYCHEEQPGDWEQILGCVAHPRVVALGETGLDLYWKDCPLPIQQASFARHWQLSRETSLPVIIHMRDCAQEVLEAVRAEAKHGPLRGVLHSFTESWEVAEELLSFGLYISFAGMLTYKKSEALRQVAKRIPLDRILVETDSPYLSPEPHRSQRPNQPAWVWHTAQCLAEVRGITLEELGELTTENALRLFDSMTFA